MIARDEIFELGGAYLAARHHRETLSHLNGLHPKDVLIRLNQIMRGWTNSGIYLQGRYEVQLLDSWGVDEPTFADAGGIYQRWDPERGAGREGFEGRAPRVNASFAPGLWQKLKIRFRAPRFDGRGRKTENARFVRVVHNGVVVQENVEITGPTRSSMIPGEAPSGPLVIQGDHGPVAVRNIRYKRYDIETVRLADPGVYDPLGRRSGRRSRSASAAPAAGHS